MPEKKQILSYATPSLRHQIRGRGELIGISILLISAVAVHVLIALGNAQSFHFSVTLV